MTPGIVLACVIGVVLGYVYGICWMLGRFERTQGRATPDKRIPWLTSALLGLALPTYWALWKGLL